MYYFAYGSNMSSNQMRQRGIYFTTKFPAVLEGYELQFNKRSGTDSAVGYASITPNAAEQVYGWVYEVENLTPLDIFEGYPKHYLRSDVQVKLLDRPGTLSATTYVANDDWISIGLRPTKAYLDRIVANLQSPPFPVEYSQKVAATSFIWVS